MADESYKRNQVAWALWRFVARGRHEAEAPPRVFLTRIKRLLELDRAAAEERPGYAFAEDAPKGQGSDMPFSAFDAFCLALALDLTDAGFKQGEVVYLLQHVRRRLRIEYDWICLVPGPVRRERRKPIPGRPFYVADGQRWLDDQVFAVIRKVEMTELYPKLAERAEPVFLEPVYCRGIEALQRELAKMNEVHRKAFVLELAVAATHVRHLLEIAPARHRGRS